MQYTQYCHVTACSYCDGRKEGGYTEEWEVVVARGSENNMVEYSEFDFTNSSILTINNSSIITIVLSLPSMIAIFFLFCLIFRDMKVSNRFINTTNFLLVSCFLFN